MRMCGFQSFWDVLNHGLRCIWLGFCVKRKVKLAARRLLQIMPAAPSNCLSTSCVLKESGGQEKDKRSPKQKAKDGSS